MRSIFGIPFYAFIVVSPVFLASCEPPDAQPKSAGAAPAGMVWIPGGEFTIGWDGREGRPDESPAHRVHVDGDDYPVVQVSWEDAVAYGEWAGKRLPTEAEWEHAARYGHDGERFAWGDRLSPDERFMANVWQGTFPHRNIGEDGFVGAAPTKSFPPTELRLYDMAGNVWEWTSDRFRPDTYTNRVKSLEANGHCVNPTGPVFAADPRNPSSRDSRVHKGGSYLCHASYCESYRPSAKMAAPPDTAMIHLGFRCVRSSAGSKEKERTAKPAVP